MLSFVVLAICCQLIAGAYPPPRPAPTYAPPAPTYAPPKPTYSPPKPTYSPPEPTYYPPESDEYGTMPPEPSQQELDEGTEICEREYVDCSDGATRVGIEGGLAFCQCSNGRAYKHNCGPGTSFDPTLSICNWPTTTTEPNYPPNPY